MIPETKKNEDHVEEVYGICKRIVLESEGANGERLNGMGSA